MEIKNYVKISVHKAARKKIKIAMDVYATRMSPHRDPFTGDNDDWNLVICYLRTCEND